MKIFLTVGTQLPFDRLVRAVDIWAGVNKDTNVFGQIGNGSYTPQAIQWTNTMTPAVFIEQMTAADLVISHAGIGSLMNAIELEKRVIIVPRRQEFGEHRNDHQIATAERLGARNLAHVAHTETELYSLLSYAFTLKKSRSEDIQVSPMLMESIRRFVSQAA